MHVLQEDTARPHILVVENDAAYREDFVTNLKYWGYEPIVARGRGQRLVDDAKQKVCEYRCCVALVDMRLRDDYDRNDRSGLELVPDLTPARSIVVSAFGDRETTRKAFVERAAFDFVGKEEHPDRLHEAIARALQQVGLANEPVIRWPPGLSSAAVVQQIARDPAAASGEADAILRGLFPEAKQIRLQRLSDAHQLRATPFQRSLVLRAWVDELEPVVVKLARAPRIEHEVQRYKDHIENRIVGNFYARLHKHRQLWDIGGAVYDLVGTSLREVQTFSFYYQDPETTEEDLQESLRHLFQEVWSVLYLRTNEPQEGSLRESYTRVWGESWNQRICAFAQQQPVMDIAGSGSLVQVPNPVAWVRQHTNLDNTGTDFSDDVEARTAITHGDLSGDNLFVDQRQIWLIDYERSGRGPILQDFVQLETDILLRLAQIAPNDVPHLMELFVAALQPRRLNQRPTTASNHPDVRKAITIIGTLRELAFELTRAAHIQQYFWGLLFNAVFRATFERPANDPQQERALLLGGLLCHRLEHIESAQWPPEAFQPRATEQPAAERPPLDAAATRKLLERALNDEELTTLCFDYFPEVYNRLSDGMSLVAKSRLLVEYCERQGKLPELLHSIEESNPYQYDSFTRQL
jgi:ActR/RegA family two-component response regulator